MVESDSRKWKTLVTQYFGIEKFFKMSLKQVWMTTFWIKGQKFFLYETGISFDHFTIFFVSTCVKTETNLSDLINIWLCCQFSLSLLSLPFSSLTFSQFFGLSASLSAYLSFSISLSVSLSLSPPFSPSLSLSASL